MGKDALVNKNINGKITSLEQLNGKLFEWPAAMEKSFNLEYLSWSNMRKKNICEKQKRKQKAN